MEGSCADCGQIVENVAEFILSGCEVCGCRKSTTVKKKEIDPDSLDPCVGIYMKGQGEFVVNLENLAKLEDKDPLMVVDSNGKINVLYE